MEVAGEAEAPGATAPDATAPDATAPVATSPDATALEAGVPASAHRDEALASLVHDPSTGEPSEAELLAEVQSLKAIIDGSASADATLAALAKLRSLGDLPTKVLGESKIGIVVNACAKSTTVDSAVRASAKDLVEDWRRSHRVKKRTNSGNLEGASVAPALRRQGSTASDMAPLSQDVAPLVPGSDPAVTRSGSLVSIEEKIDQKDSETRKKVRQKLVDALGKEEDVEMKGDIVDDNEEVRDPVVLATEIEEALFQQLMRRSSEKEYLNQTRSILFNIKDTKNPTFRWKLSVGFYKPDQIPKLTAEDMASDAKNAERAKMRLEAAEAIQSDWSLRHGEMRICGMFTCGKCKGTKTTYFQMQTRSSDEPMTTFVTCLTCNNRWKFC